MSGEVEIVRTNLSNVFVNKDTGVLGIVESNEEKKLIRSKAVHEDSASYNNRQGISTLAKYLGSDFYITV